MKNYLIAGISCCIDACDQLLPTAFDSFIVPSDYQEYGMIFSVGHGEIFPQGNLLFSENGMNIYKNNGYYHVIFVNADGQFFSGLTANLDWSQCNIYLRKGNPSAIKSLCEIAFRTRILFYDGLVFHASALLYEQKSIAFCGHSGAGKTTQARLWQQYFSADILNGDRPALRLANHQAIIYGTPWSGASQDFLNASAPLEAIIFVQQANENKLVSLSPQDAAPLWLPRCFLPFWDQDLLELALEQAQKALGQTSFYILRCRPEKEAALLVREALV